MVLEYIYLSVKNSFDQTNILDIIHIGCEKSALQIIRDLSLQARRSSPPKTLLHTSITHVFSLIT